MQKIKTFFRNLSFKNKIIVMAVMIGLIPTILLGGFSYYKVTSLLIEREKKALNESLHQELSSLNNKFIRLNSAINYITLNQELSNKLNQKYTSNFEMYMLYRDYISPIFSSLYDTNSEIEKIVIYTDNDISSRSGILEPLSVISNDSWYNNFLENPSPFMFISKDDRKVLLISKINVAKPNFTTIVCMTLNYDKIFSSLNNLFNSPYGVIITDSDNKLLYEFNSIDSKFSYSDLSLDFTENLFNKNFVVNFLPFSLYGWNTYIYTTKEIITTPTYAITLIVILGIILCIFLITFFSTLFSNIIVQPLEALSQNMHEIEHGNLSVTVPIKYNDEIGQLITSFKRMVDKINHLINEVYKSKIAQQEYEMQALQSQINPHFLYNSLSLINSKAILSDQDDISQMSLMLSTFYRTTLNKGKNIISVKDELENIRSYCSIQSLLHTNSFDINYNIDEKAFNYQMINLLLQPLVENAIMHGINHISDQRRGKLDITCSLIKDNIVFIVSDNGCGIEKTKLDTLLEYNSNSYGIKNVNKRVKLYYGEEYGLRYISEKNMGTTAILTLPCYTKNSDV
jgi:two-component system, sensor histidine kinase YesM